MNMEQYKNQMNRINPRSSFEAETAALLCDAAGARHREENILMKKKYKITLALAAAIVLLTGTVFAASALLRADEVADMFGESAIAEAFRSDDAVVINESQQSGEYIFTLLGIVSGEGLDDCGVDVDCARSFVVLSIAYADGREFTQLDSRPPVTVSPVIDGYEPLKVSIYSLNSYRLDTVSDGVIYCLIATDSLEIFTDHTVRIAVFDGIAPGSDIFTMGADGEIKYSEGYNGHRAMFELPLDSSKADPEAAAEFIRQIDAQWTATDDSADSAAAIDAEIIGQLEAQRDSTDSTADGAIVVYDGGAATTCVYSAGSSEVPAEYLVSRQV